jgi:hypothetical protein
MLSGDHGRRWSVTATIDKEEYRIKWAHSFIRSQFPLSSPPDTRLLYGTCSSEAALCWARLPRRS